MSDERGYEDLAPGESYRSIGKDPAPSVGGRASEQGEPVHELAKARRSYLLTTEPSRLLIDGVVIVGIAQALIFVLDFMIRQTGTLTGVWMILFSILTGILWFVAFVGFVNILWSMSRLIADSIDQGSTR